MYEENFTKELEPVVEETVEVEEEIPTEPVVEEIVPEVVEDTTETTVTGFVTGVVTGCLQLAVRKEAKANADVVRLVDALTKVTVNLDESTEDWYKVSTGSGIGGYCMKKFVTVK